MAQKTFDRVCGFCGKDVEGVGRYIYPVPGDPDLMDNRVGKLACADCGGGQYRLQVEQGLVEQVEQVGQKEEDARIARRRRQRRRMGTGLPF